MKTKILIALLSIYGIANAQEKISMPIDSATGKVVYTEIVYVESKTKDELYLNGKEWLANTFKSSKEVIDMDDKEAGQIIGKGLFVVSLNGDWGYIHFTVALYFKDGRYKYEIKNISHENPKSSSRSGLGDGGAVENEKPACGKMLMSKKQWEKIKVNADSNIKNLIADLNYYMIKSNSSDW